MNCPSCKSTTFHHHWCGLLRHYRKLDADDEKRGRKEGHVDTDPFIDRDYPTDHLTTIADAQDDQ